MGRDWCDGSRVLVPETSPFAITDNGRQGVHRAPRYVVRGMVGRARGRGWKHERKSSSSRFLVWTGRTTYDFLKIRFLNCFIDPSLCFKSVPPVTCFYLTTLRIAWWMLFVVILSPGFLISDVFETFYWSELVLSKITVENQLFPRRWIV